MESTPSCSQCIKASVNTGDATEPGMEQPAVHTEVRGTRRLHSKFQDSLGNTGRPHLNKNKTTACQKEGEGGENPKDIEKLTS